MSREAWQRIVDGYQGFDAARMYEDEVCLYAVSKMIRGETAVQQQDVQKCPDCQTLKRAGEYRMEIESGPCDSDKSRSLLDGQAQGQLVAAYEDGDETKRGGMSGNLQWQGAGSMMYGRTFAVLNAGTHHDPVADCERCATPGHAEGWLRAAVVEGECKGCRVNGAITYKFERRNGGVAFYAVLEGLLICQCND